MSFINQAFLK